MDYSKDSKKFWRNQIKARGVQALGGKCILCGQVYEDCCFDFHKLTSQVLNIVLCNYDI